MALPSDPIQLSTLAVMEAFDGTAQGDCSKASLSTSSASFSSCSSKESVPTSSCKKQHGQREAGRKRKRKQTPPCKVSAGASPCTQAADACRPAPIIRRFSADKSQFKDIVHQFTGLPTPPSPPPPRLPLLPSYSPNILVAAIAQSLQNLETISAYLLLHSSHENNILLNEIKNSTFLHTLRHSQDGYKGSNHDMGTYTFDGPSSVIKSSSPSSVDILKPLLTNALPKHNTQGMLGVQELRSANISSILQKNQQIAELKHVLLSDNAPNNVLSLVQVLLKQMVSQQTPLAR